MKIKTKPIAFDQTSKLRNQIHSPRSSINKKQTETSTISRIGITSIYKETQRKSCDLVTLTLNGNGSIKIVSIRSQELIFYQRIRIPNSTGAEERSIDETHTQSSQSENPSATNAQQSNQILGQTRLGQVSESSSDEKKRTSIFGSKKIVVATTCLDEDKKILVEKFVEMFSEVVFRKTLIDCSTTHLITNDDEELLKSPSSIELIEAIAHHCFCVSYRWVEKCLEENRIVEEETFEIHGDDLHLESHFAPQRSRLRLESTPLFENFSFFIQNHDESENQMTRAELENLIVQCGGRVSSSIEQLKTDKYQGVIVSDRHFAESFKIYRSIGLRFVPVDWIFLSILEYRQKPILLFEH